MNKKLNILLLAMPNTTYGFNRVTKLPHIGLRSLAANLDDNLVEKIEIVDLVTVRKDLKKYIINLINKLSPDVVGLSAMSFQYQTAVEISKIIRKTNSNIITILGGYHVTIDYETISNSPDAEYFDYFVRGEGEIAFNKLIKYLTNMDGELSDIENISFKKNGSFLHNERSGNLDLENIKLPLRSSKNSNKFYFWGKKADTIETSRGCTMPCNFCCMPAMYGRTFRTHKMDRFIKDLKNAINNGAEAIFIVDDNAFLNTKHMFNVCNAIIDNGLNKIDYLIQASVRGIVTDETLVEKMAEAGFKFVFLGIENVNSGDIDFLSKDKSVLKDSERAVELLHQNNIIVAAGFVIGLPDDTAESILSNYNFARKLKIDNPVFSVVTPFVFTGVRDELLDDKLVTNKFDYCFFDTVQTNVRTKNLTAEEVSYLSHKMYADYFDWEFVKFSKFRKIYPYFFYKLLLQAIPNYLFQLFLPLFVSNPALYNYKKSREILINDMKRYLLDREEKILAGFNTLDLSKLKIE